MQSADPLHFVRGDRAVRFEGVVKCLEHGADALLVVRDHGRGGTGGDAFNDDVEYRGQRVLERRRIGYEEKVVRNAVAVRDAIQIGVGGELSILIADIPLLSKVGRSVIVAVDKSTPLGGVVQRAFKLSGSACRADREGVGLRAVLRNDEWRQFRRGISDIGKRRTPTTTGHAGYRVGEDAACDARVGVETVLRSAAGDKAEQLSVYR